MNKVTLIGRLGRDADLKYTRNGTAVSNLSIATTEKRKNGDKYEDYTEWHRCTVFSKRAEAISKYLSKGDGIAIDGRLQTRKWDDSGTTRYATEIIIDNFEFLPTRKNEGGTKNPNESSQSSAPSQSGGEELPF